MSATIKLATDILSEQLREATADEAKKIWDRPENRELILTQLTPAAMAAFMVELKPDHLKDFIGKPVTLRQFVTSEAKHFPCLTQKEYDSMTNNSAAPYVVGCNTPHERALFLDAIRDRLVARKCYPTKDDVPTVTDEVLQKELPVKPINIVPAATLDAQRAAAAA